MFVSWLTQSDQSDFSIGGVYFSYTPPRRCIFFAWGLASSPGSLTGRKEEEEERGGGGKKESLVSTVFANAYDAS